MNNLVISVSPDSSLEQLGQYADVFVLDAPNLPEVSKAYDTVYIRSHFNRPETLPQNFRMETHRLVAAAKNLNPNVTFIDSMDTVDTIVDFEDKWHQYTLFGDLMPKTLLYDTHADVSTLTRPIYKNRLSSRGQGVTWDSTTANSSQGHWIAQESLDIVEEMRIYGVWSEVYPVCSLRHSKSAEHDAEVVDYRDLTKDEIDFAASAILKASGLDFVGLDVARTADGTLYLLEANRSPGFSKFFQLTGINLADTLYTKVS